MDNRILSSVLSQYEALRKSNARLEEERREEIARLHPDLMALVHQRHDLVLGAVRSLFSVADGQDIEKTMAEYNRKIAALLVEKGYPAAYLSPIYRCENCRDSGYFYDAQQRRQMCPCLKQALQAAPSENGSIADKEATFDSFDLTRFPDTPLPDTDVTQREYMAILRDKCLSYAQALPSGPYRTLLLHGGSGLGKTYLLRCIAHLAKSRAIETQFVSAYDLLMHLKNAYFSRDDADATEYFTVPLLIIDDLGMEPLMENITVEQIYHLINARLEKGLYTAISTNLSRVELQKRYTERVSSRLLNPRTGITLPFLGKDIRLIKETAK